MEITRESKKSLIYAIIFSVAAIVFGLLYYFQIIKGLNLIMAVCYVSYFVGIALIFNGSYCKSTNRNKSKTINYLIGTIIILCAGALLIYGFASGSISMFH